MLATPRLVQRGRLLPVAGVLVVVLLVAFVRYRRPWPQSSWSRSWPQKPSFQRVRPSPQDAIDTQRQGHGVTSDCQSGVAHLDLDNGVPDLTAAFRYSRRCVRPVFRAQKTSANPTARRPPTPMPGRLIPAQADMVMVNRTALGTTCSRPLPACETLELEVPLPYPTASTANYSHLLFGVASSSERMMKALDGFTHWLGGTGAQLVAIVQDADGGGAEQEKEEEDWLDEVGTQAKPGIGKTATQLAGLAALETAYRARGIRLRALPPQHRLARTVVQNHFAVLLSLLEAATPDTRWLSIVDDDTFFPSLYKLDQALRRYDHTRSTWLGALSEDADALALWGRMAYGGAGAFISVPLAETVMPYIGECLRQGRRAALAALEEEGSKPTAATARGRDSTTTGDGLLRDCMARHAPATPLTLVPGLNQHDLYGDAAGFYEAGLAPLSVHHWRSWYKAPLPAMAAVMRVCGDCFLKRWTWTGAGSDRGGEDDAGDTLFVNGYSVTMYRAGVHPDFRRMEETWSHAGDEFVAGLGPLRPALDDADKKSYRLREVVAGEHGANSDSDSGSGVASFRQVYVYKGAFGNDELDEVFELVWDEGEGATWK
ncbi:hypothetical protein HMPREF1624_07745 [Sporothrix schenckii ATCC 58251]|uniref:Fringe-like glycosyltransferase domain-containing protein n=1 Tax=Sporothrix schenckii (strain ATCC 58251 / de Perez 2211183) TaxID=1391915 RepID=U7PL64_SPOS1|nr:hypothetical protein HMPREF1624_07745 [Sporothrix schenckii ATCC 58251]